MFILDDKGKGPLHDKIYKKIKGQILSGELPPARKLMSIKRLSVELSVSRNTVEYAYQQLHAEGYVQSKPKSGYYVSLIEQEHIVATSPQVDGDLAAKNKGPQSYAFDFHPACLSPGSFPIHRWRTLYIDCLKQDAKQLSSYSQPQGDYALRCEIQKYLERSRGVACQPEQIVICSGLQDGLSFVAPILKEKHSLLAVEDPGYFIPKSVFHHHSFEITPIPVKSEGLDIDELQKTDCAIVYVTPSHQFPLGHVMPVANRLKLIEWSESVGGVIIEDDYDSELRYLGRPIPALQGLHPQGNIVYMGTFSKVLSPVLRISYMVLPYSLLNIYHRLFSNYSMNVPLLEQRTLYRFMQQGYWERHLCKMRTLYKKKHDGLIQSIHQHFGERANIIGQGAGLHVVVELVGNSLSEEELIQRAKERDVRLFPVSKTYLHYKSEKPQIMLGFGSMSSHEIDQGVKLLYEAWYLT